MDQVSSTMDDGSTLLYRILLTTRQQSFAEAKPMDYFKLFKLSLSSVRSMRFLSPSVFHSLVYSFSLAIHSFIFIGATLSTQSAFLG
jgi:hypothetical protein